MNLFSKTTVLLFLAAILAACGRTSAVSNQASLVDIAQAAARQDDRVTADQLSSWLIEDRRDFMLVDVRLPADYEKGQIGDAHNIPIAKLMTSEELASLPTDRKIVLYSNGSENAAKAEVMLRLAGYDAHLLAGGYNAWYQRILNPDISVEEFDGEDLQVSAQRAYSCYFVGERSGQGARGGTKERKPFVPPVFTEEADLDVPPPQAGEEAC
jgi:rhodanese-related sulfurtransferase